MYNLNYSLKGYKVEEKLHLGVREKKRLNSIVLNYGHDTSNCAPQNTNVKSLRQNG
jgi:hypothetical protein